MLPPLGGVKNGASPGFSRELGKSAEDAWRWSRIVRSSFMSRALSQSISIGLEECAVHPSQMALRRSLLLVSPRRLRGGRTNGEDGTGGQAHNTLPSTRWLRPGCPWVAMTIRATFSASAVSRIVSYGTPTTTWRVIIHQGLVRGRRRDGETILPPARRQSGSATSV